MPGSILNITKY